MRRARAVITLLALVVLAAGCATQGRPVVAERSHTGDRNASSYVVRKGDTLYSIAWRFGLDVAALARANGLRPPYTIYPQQRLRLRPLTVRPRPPATASKPKASVKKPSPAAAGAPRFRWPGKRQPSREFGRGNKGLDFELTAGSPVLASASGEVVYAGSGLGGYERLVIIRHTGGYLSAYSFNQPALVSEGDTVKAGAKLADIRGAGRAAKLHFEIRKDGEPISPRSVLR